MKIKFYLVYIVIGLLIGNSLIAQTKVCYTYDASGNRTARFGCSKSAIAKIDSMLISKPITEIQGEMAISLFPNPTKGHVTINIANMPDNANGEIILSDMTGRLLLKQSTFRVTTQLDLSSHPTGLYVLKISIDDKVSEWKVIKE